MHEYRIPVNHNHVDGLHSEYLSNLSVCRHKIGAKVAGPWTRLTWALTPIKRLIWGKLILFIDVDLCEMYLNYMISDLNTLEKYFYPRTSLEINSFYLYIYYQLDLYYLKIFKNVFKYIIKYFWKNHFTNLILFISKNILTYFIQTSYFIILSFYWYCFQKLCVEKLIFFVET